MFPETILGVFACASARGACMQKDAMQISRLKVDLRSGRGFMRGSSPSMNSVNLSVDLVGVA
jgi:hypothetical protein